MIAIVSDIHGNLPALQAVLEAIEDAGASEIISLGDVAGYYSQVDECIELLIEKRARHIMGNHDWYLVTDNPCPRSRSANLAISFQRKHVSSKGLEWLSRSPLRLEELGISCVHGGWVDPLDEYVRDVSEAYFRSRGASYYFSGHTHVQTAKTFSSCVYCNPGSVGQPRDGNPEAAFALFDGESVSLRRVPYDIDLVAQSMSGLGFASRFYEGLYDGVPIGASESNKGRSLSE